MTPPIAPTPEQFGLTPEALAKAPKPIFRYKYGHWLLFAIALTMWGLIAYNYYSSHFWIALVLGSPFGWLALGFVAVLFTWAVFQVDVKIRSAFCKNFAAAESYRVALDQYRAHLARYQAWEKKRRADFWRSLSGVQFESELGRLFQRMGYAVRATPPTGDGGVDLVLQKGNVTTVVQCKAHNKRIPINVARELSAAIVDYGADEGIIACFDGVTGPVTRYIANKPIGVLSLNEILKLQEQFG